MSQSLMRLFRATIAVLLVLLWVPITNSCAIAAAFPGTVHAACDCEEEEKESKENGVPCNSGKCVPCATLENGVNLAALSPVVVPQPVCSELSLLMELLRKFAQMEIARVRDPVPIPPPIPPPAWQDDVKTALPVRGPSLVA